MAFDPFSSGQATEIPAANAPPSSNGFDPFASGQATPLDEAPLDPLAARTKKYQEEQDKGVLPTLGEYALNVANPENWRRVGEGLWDTAKSIGSGAQDLLSGKAAPLGDLQAAAMAQFPGGAAYERYLSNPYRFLTSHFVPGGNSPEQLREMAKADLAREASTQAELEKAPNPERASSLMMVTDPLNAALFAGPLARGAGLVGDAARGAEAAAAVGKAGEFAPVASLTRRAAAAVLDPLGAGTEKIGQTVEAGRGYLPGKINAVQAKYAIPPSIAAQGGRAVTFGAIGNLFAGHAGAALGAAIASAPETLQTLGGALRAAARALVAGEGSEGFFETIARDATVGPKVQTMAAFLDRTGLGRVLEGTARTLHEGAGAAILFSPIDILTSGGDTDQAAQQTLSNFAFASLGHAAGEPLRDNSRAVIALKQANDVAWFMGRSERAADLPALQERLQNRGDPRELIAIAQYARAHPNEQIHFVKSGKDATAAHFDTATGTVELNLDSPDWMPQILGHEMVHAWNASGKRGDALLELLGNPETRKDGFLVSYDPETGAPKYREDAEVKFGSFVNRYLERLQNNLNAQGMRPEEVTQRVEAYKNNLGALAEEYLAESLGSWLGSFTKKGELVFSRVRRNRFFDSFLERFAGDDVSGVPASLQRLFGVTAPQAPRFGVGGIPNSLRKLYSQFIRSHESARGRPEDFQYDKNFRTQSFSQEDVQKNPADAARFFGNSDEFVFSTDSQGNPTGNVEFRKAREAEKIAQARAAALVDILANRKPTNPLEVQRRERIDKNGVKTVEFSGRHLPDDVIQALVDAGHLSPRQADSIRRQNEVMGSGQPVRVFYQKASHKGKFGAFVGEYKDIIPFEWQISQPKGAGKGANLLIRNVDLGQVRDNFDGAVRRAKRMNEGVPFSSREEAMAALKTYLTNQSRGYGGTGEVREGTPPPALPAAGKLSVPQRDFINELLGVNLRDVNDVRLKAQDAGEKLSTSAIKSFRMDRTATLDVMASEQAAPVDYNAIKNNFSPSEDEKREAPATFLGIQKGPNGKPGIELYNLTQDVNGHPKGSTVSRQTLESAGFSVPEVLQSPSEKQTDTPEFKKWFGDSKVVDEKGEPLVVYHGTKSPVEAFSKTRDGTVSSILGEAKVERHGIFVTPNPGLAGEFATQGAGAKTGAATMPLFASIKHPLDMMKGYSDELFSKVEDWGNKQGMNGYRIARNLGDRWNSWELFDKDGGNAPEFFLSMLKDLGYDGAKFWEPKVAGEPHASEGETYVAFDPTQIKSAIGNKGTFDPKNPNILSSPSEEGEVPAEKQSPKDADFDIASFIKENPSGFTVNPYTGKVATTGYAVAPSKGTEFIVSPEDLTSKKVFEYIMGHGELFGEGPETHAFLGGWLNPETGKVVLDVSKVVDNLSDALHIALNGQQDAIFHLDTGTTIPTQEGIDSLRKAHLWREGEGGDAAGVRASDHKNDAGKRLSEGLNSPSEGTPEQLQQEEFFRKKVAGNLTPQELNKMRADTVRNVAKAFQEVIPVQELAAAAEAGKVKRGWYTRAAGALRAMFGPDTDLFVGLLASTSPQQSVVKNLHMSLKAWKKWTEAGRPTDRAELLRLFNTSSWSKDGGDLQLKARTQNAIRALRGEPLSDKSFKVDSFRRNLLGDLDAVTNDTWNAKLSDVEAKLLGKKSGYLGMTAVYRAAAKRLGGDWTPAEVQETAWSFMKTLSEMQVGGKKARDILKGLSDIDIAKTPDFASLITDDLETQKQLRDVGIDPSVAGNFRQSTEASADAILARTSPRDQRLLGRIARRAERQKAAELAREASEGLKPGDAGYVAPPVHEAAEVEQPFSPSEAPADDFAGGTRRLVHGGTGELKAGRPIWFTSDVNDAKWFSGERGGENPQLVHADVTIKNPAREADVEAAAKAVGATEQDIRKHSDYEGSNLLDFVYVPKVVEELKRKGFDGVIDSDVLENTSIMAYIPFDQSQVNVVKRQVGKRLNLTDDDFTYFSPSEERAPLPAAKARALRRQARIKARARPTQDDDDKASRDR